MTDRRFNLRFVLVMSAFVGVVLLTYREEVLEPALRPLDVATATVTGALLEWTGLDVVREGTRIYQPGGFIYWINYSCTCILPVAFLVVAVLAYPGRLRRKIPGIAVGVPLLLGLNQIRLVSLFYIGTYRPSIYDLAHLVVWESLMIIAIIAIWWAWARWADANGALQPAPGTRRRPYGTGLAIPFTRR